MPEQAFEMLILIGAGKKHDAPLIEALARAFYWKSLLDTGVVNSHSDIARQEGLTHSFVSELMRLTLLAPDVVETILDGTQPAAWSLQKLKRTHLPKDWQAQRALLANIGDKKHGS